MSFGFPRNSLEKKKVTRSLSMKLESELYYSHRYILMRLSNVKVLSIVQQQKVLDSMSSAGFCPVFNGPFKFKVEL